MTVEYSGITHDFRVQTMDDGAFLVTVEQDRILDPVLKKTELHTVNEMAADKAELAHIFNQCFPDKE